MKKTLIPIIVIIGLILPLYLNGRTIRITKSKFPKIERKIHPLQKYFSSRRNFDQNKRNSNKLLVLLVEFQPDDDPKSTGDGTFLDAADAEDYPVTLGRPPHDYDYFMKQMEALKYYYLAASLGNFELDYDIFPKPATKDSISAYRLPHEMSYYNPSFISGNTDLMIDRFEEYFRDSFLEADKDENIDFSQYEHFMLIHAGSDWQHDIFGDTPYDIPSFFIEMREGSEVAVDDGSIIIDHSCNIPETITQDIVEDNSSDVQEIYGYGLINAVVAHEFGHSLGFVDLYNVRTSQPEVGYYDIMDSGGFGLAGYGIDEDDDGYPETVYYLEGGFPLLPGAWTRLLAWEDEFREMGILKDIYDLNFNEEIQLKPVETFVNPQQNLPYFVKIPLSSTEYILLENRQADPDGDGGITPIFSDDEKVVLYPTVVDTSFGTDPTYEYDYFLPGWIDRNGNSFGGGIVVWHIDEAILQENDNFENNMVNTRHSRRAVKIIEADNIEDIGNQFSSYWRGTEYEPYYKFMPKFDSELGYFVGWDNQFLPDGTFMGRYHNDVLSATSKPPLETNEGNPSIFSIYDISSYPIGSNEERIMSFKLGSQIFDVTNNIAEFDSIVAIGPVSSVYSFPAFPVISSEGTNYYSKIGNFWANNFGIDIPFFSPNSQPLVTGDYNGDGNNEILFVSGKNLTIISADNSEYNPPIIATYHDSIVDAPLYLSSLFETVIATKDSIFVGNYLENCISFLDIPSAKLAFDGNSIIAVSENYLYYIDPNQPTTENKIKLPEDISDYLPVCYYDSLNVNNNAIFVQSDNGNIYRIHNDSWEQIFSTYPYSSAKPTQLALGELFDDETPYLIFGAGERVFAMTLHGSLVPEFPAYLEHKSLLEKSSPWIIDFDGEKIILIEDKKQGFFAIDNQANIRLEYSLFWNKPNADSYFYYDETNKTLDFIYAADSKLLNVSYLTEIEKNPIIWNGFKNGGTSFFESSLTLQPVDDNDLSAFAYPNPARRGEVKIRVLNASDKIELKIFDIAGNLIFRTIKEKEESVYQDIPWDTRKISSGVYFGIVKSGNTVSKVPIAIEN